MGALATRLHGFLAKFFPHVEVADDEDIFALGLANSLLLVQIVLFIEHEFGITLADEDLAIDHFRSINALVALIQQKQGEGLPALHPE